MGTSDDRGCGAGGGGDRGSGEPSQPDDRCGGAGEGSKALWDIDDEELSVDSSEIDLGVLTSVVADDGSDPEELCVEAVDGKPVIMPRVSGCARPDKDN